MATDAEKEAWHSRGFFERDLPPAVVDAARAEAAFPEPSGKPDFGSGGRYEFPCGLDGVDMLPFALLGGVGGICVASHVVGREMLAMQAAADVGDEEQARAIDADLMPLY